MLKKDLSKMTIKEIEGNKRGELPTKLIVNSLIENDYYLYFISNEAGNILFTCILNNGLPGTVAFTESNIAVNYINRNDIKKTILIKLGKRLVVVKLSLLYLQNFMDESVTPLNTIIVNPSDDFFVPLPLQFFKSVANVSDSREEENIFDEPETRVLVYDKDTKKFIDGEREMFVE